ncbi:hypothetical protein [Natrinema sp. CGMCC1.2065]|uniref:hypothetical protein n=1 Tax=Natrinema sp. CGMCC1.2065 TaxID=3445767 RepID=UPI003F4A35BD
MSSASSPDIPDKSWSNPFPEEAPLWELFNEVLEQDRDIVIIIDDYRARRGTGKTVTSLQLADGMDQTAEGLTIEKTSLSPEEVRNAYTTQPPRSGLVLDEGEVGASNREAMTNTNKALREIMSMGRVEQKYVVLNAPAKSFIDKDILRLADVWITMVRRGLGLVHFLEHEPYSGQLLTRQVQWIETEDIPKNTQLRDVYNKLTQKKRERMGDGDGGDAFVPAAEHKDELKKAREAARKETRDDIVRGIWNHPEIQETAVSQRMLGEAIGVSQATISNIISGDGDGD